MILEIAGLVLLVAVGAFLVTPMIRSGRRQALQARWPRVPAEVIDHRVRVVGRREFPEYRVRYRMEGRDFDRFVGSVGGLAPTVPAPTSPLSRLARAQMARRPVGSRTEIMVNPADHDEAYIAERELPARAIAFATASVFLLFFVVFFFIAFD